MKWLLSVLLIFVAGGSLAEHRPTPEDVAFTGRVTVVSDPDALLAGSIALDDPVVGSYQLAGPLPDERSLRAPMVLGMGAQPAIEEVDYNDRCGELSGTVGSLLLSARGVDVATTDFEVGAGTDRYSVRGTGDLPQPVSGLPFDVQVELRLADAGGEAAMLAQPLPLPGDLASWDTATIAIVGCAFGSRVCSGSAPRFEIEAVVDTLSAARSDTCLVTDLDDFDGEVRLKNMNKVLVADTAPASVDEMLVRSDGSLRLRVDPMTELVGDLTKVILGTSRVKRRFEIASESEPALLSYIEARALDLGATIVAQADGKTPTLTWLVPYDGLDSSLELRANFRYDEAGGASGKGQLVLKVDLVTP